MFGSFALSGVSVFSLFFVALAAFFVFKAIVVVPQQSAYVVERLGKFYAVLDAGVHFIVPFVDRVAYKHSLKEQAIDIPEQMCITRDNVQVGVDGVIYVQVLDPKQASYGVENYLFAVTQLAQTAMRSEIGKLDLDETFKERERMNAAIVQAVDEAASAWGVKVLRYEIKNITPPKTVLEAMERQMKAEREKRAEILESEGKKQATINIAEAEKKRVVLESEAEMEKKINEAKGQAEAIREVAHATAEGIREIAKAIQEKGGVEAVNLRIAEKLVEQFGNLAKETNTLILPADFGNLASLIAGITSVVKSTGKKTNSREC